jgi:uncharacterized protein
MFEWDARKAAVNRTKHGVSFEEAATVFGDPDALDGPDLRHSETESRFMRLGRAGTGRVLILAYTVRTRRWRKHPHHQRAPGEPQRAGGLYGVLGLISPTFRRLPPRNSERCDAWDGPPWAPRPDD